MKNELSFVVLLIGLALLPSAAGQSGGTSTAPGFGVSGEVKLVQAASGTAARDLSGVVVWLASGDAVRPTSLPEAARRYRMAQRNKAFEPRLLVVPVGSLVDFPNLDPWFHNVFSLYRGKRFDLGLYEAGTHKTIKFDRPGASYIFCNIHPEMAAVVLAVDSDLYAISDKSGRISIEHVPQGRYLLRVWSENSDSRHLDALERPITVDHNTSFGTISVPVNEQNLKKHKNKYGRDYDPKPGSADY